MDTVLNVPELLRSIVSHGSQSVMILFSARRIYQQEPCAAHYHEWSIKGCPSTHMCLSGVGGSESTFCIGRFLVSSGHMYLFSVEKPLVEVTLQIDNIISFYDVTLGCLFLTFDSGYIKIRIFAMEQEHFRVIISHSGWQKKDDSFIFTKDDVKKLTRTVLRTTGTLIFDNRITLNLPRNLSLNVCLVDNSEIVWNILQVSRVG